jgi:SsrA-binding protein
MDYATNPKANFDYEIVETLEAGILLKGYEVKSIKSGKVSLKGSYVKILNGKPVLLGAIISPYQTGNVPPDYNPQATHELLLGKREVDNLIGLSKSQGLTLVPIKLYPKGSLVKLLIGVARGKKKHDKRESIKKKDVARAQQRGIE